MVYVPNMNHIYCLSTKQDNKYINYKYIINILSKYQTSLINIPNKTISLYISL